MPASRKELTLTRIFNAPRQMVFDAWIDPRQMARWWGPKCFTNPVCELDARPGGAILVHMTGPDGTVYPMGGTFHEIDPPQRIVMTTTAFKDDKDNVQLEVLNTVTFTQLNDGRTELKLHAVVVQATPAMNGALAGMEEGWSQSLDKLKALVVQI